MVNRCIFCSISKGEFPSNIIYKNESFFSVPDKNQKVPGHSLIISKKHFRTLLEMPINLGGELMDCIKKTSLIIMKKEKATGFNILQNNFPDAGQVIEHVHFHLFPRKKGDKTPSCF